MRDLIYMITPSSQSVAQNGVIPLTTIARRKGCTINSNDGSTVKLLKCGYYHITGTITLNGTAGTSTIAVYKNGVAVPGATASETIETSGTDIHEMTLDCIIRVFPIDLNATVSLVNTGVNINTTNVSLSVEYEC